MASKNIVEIVIKATDKASKQVKGVGSVFKKLGMVAGTAGVAVVAAGAAIGVVAFKLAKEAAQVEKLSNTFDALSKSIGENSEVMIKDLRVASRGMLNDADLMQASNKLVAMGLAGTSKESARLVEISTQLGLAMGMTATDSAEAFALMLANQSIPRLDNFGISSGKVRERILELMEANEDMTRETAFMTATLEEAEKTMGKVGEQGEGAAANMSRLTANIDNLKVEIGKRFLPVLDTLTSKLLEMWDDPQIQAGITRLITWIEGVVGDETSGIIGVLAYLLKGDLQGAFVAVFGVELLNTLINFQNRSAQILYGFKILISYEIPRAFRIMKEAIKVLLVETALEINMFVTNAVNELSVLTALLGTVSGQPYRPVKTPYIDLFLGEATSRTTYSGGRASGGPVSAGGSYLVGERGPEMLTMGSDGYVTPNNKLGGITVHLHMNSAVSLANRAEAERVLVPFIEKGIRTVMAR